IMKSPTSQLIEDGPDAERLRQIARRKEQNRNAQRRLRERKEEYTMQLEAQLAELHRRSQSQEEESHFLREALSRMRAENQSLAQQISLIHQAVPSTQTTHPLPQRASIDLGIDPFAPIAGSMRSRNRSQSATQPTHPAHPGAPTMASPWSASVPVLHSFAHVPAFGSTIHPHITHRPPVPASMSSSGPIALAGGLSLAVPESPEDVTMPLSTTSNEASRAASSSPSLHRRDSLAPAPSPFDARSMFSRHGSDQTDITIPSDRSDTDMPLSTKLRRSAPSLHGGAVSQPSAADTMMASCLDSIHSVSGSSGAAPQMNASAAATQKAAFEFAASWIASSSESAAGNLSIPDLRSTDMSSASKPLGITPGALGLAHGGVMSSGGEGWTISPWINMSQAASNDNTAASHHTPAEASMQGVPSDLAKSLASRRGFSGSLKLEPPLMS
ncbi:hypothetical protein BCV70DRAFT_161489, partial [Testicularia cyperi]